MKAPLMRGFWCGPDISGCSNLLPVALSERRLGQVPRAIYQQWVFPRVRRPIARQRIKMAWLVWGYWRVLTARGLRPLDRLRAIARFIRIDWCVLHAHWPIEIGHIARAIAVRPARPGEVFVEAGCWNGGSTAKFSILCGLLGYRLHVYDSFQGVRMTDEERAVGYDYSGEYSAAEDAVRAVVARYGEPSTCSWFPGWFEDTLASPVARPVRAAYIDCDTAAGTEQVLRSTVPALVDDGVVFSQDFHIPTVRELLESLAVWERLGVVPPLRRQLGSKLVSLRWGSSGD